MDRNNYNFYKNNLNLVLVYTKEGKYIKSDIKLLGGGMKYV